MADRSDPTRRVTRYGNARIHTFNYGGKWEYQIFIGNDLHIYGQAGGFGTRARAISAAKKFAEAHINIYRPRGYRPSKKRYRRRHNPLELMTITGSAMRAHARRVRNPKPSTALLVVAGIAAVGGVAYYLSTKSATTTPQPNAPIATAAQFQPGNTYSFTAPLPSQLNAAAAVTGLKPVLESLGWSNVTVTSITPSTYTVTATWSGPQPFAIPAGVTLS